MKTKLTNYIVALLTLLTLSTLNSQLSTALAQGTAFTYQGRLNTGGAPANGVYDLEFMIHDAEVSGSQIGPTFTTNGVSVSNGLFTVTLNFGAGVFDGNARWLIVGVRTNGGASYTVLSPRQALTPAPYALYAPTAGMATVASTASAVAPGSIGAGALQVGAVDSSSIANGTITTTDLSSALASNTFWRLDGNIGTTPGLQTLGTLDNAALEFKVNNTRALRLEPGTDGAVNVIGGHAGNSTGTNMGATIGGGGNWTSPNFVRSDFGTVAGGMDNQIGEGARGATISGGAQNSIQTNANYSTIAGGQNNRILGGTNGPAFSQAARWSLIGGGQNHLIEPYAYWSVIGGGLLNRVQYDADYVILAGGSANLIGTNADYSVIGGGNGNVVSNGAECATIPGGVGNAVGASFGFAAGRLASAAHQGTFVWADSQAVPFTSTAQNQFLIRAAGGVSINTNNPSGAALNVAGSVRAQLFEGNGVGLTGIVPADDSVTAAKIAGSAVGTAELANNAVNSGKIADGGIATDDLADNSVTALKLASDSASLNKVTAGSMTMNGVRPQLNSNDLLLKSDDKHGLGYYGNTKFFGGVAVDGPVLYGYSGGGLGTVTFTATNLAMVWKSTGNVGIGATNPATRLDIFGTNSIASGVDGIVNIGDSTAAHLTLDANEVQARSGASDTTLLLNRMGGSVAVGIASPSAKLDVNGDTRVRGVLRTGAENTGEAPSPAGLVVRRINSTSGGAGNVLAKARTQGNAADITLERDGTPGGFLIRYPANPGYVTIACMGMDNTGTVRNFYTTLADPGTEGTVQIYATALNLVHFQCTFGITYNPGQHLTQVTLSRFKSASVNDDYWFGTVTSTYNQ